MCLYIPKYNIECTIYVCVAATTLSNILFVDICLPQDDILKLSHTCDGNIPNAVYTMADLLHAELQGAVTTIPSVCDREYMNKSFLKMTDF